MSGGHALAADRGAARHKRRLQWVFGLVVIVMLAELGAALATNSLALLSDAGHMATDAIGLGMALAAITAADNVQGGAHRTYGLYRLEILAALANAVLLFGLAGYVLYAAIQRLGSPVQIHTGPMLVVAAIGLMVNLAGWRLLREGAAESLNVEGALLEVLADLWGSVGVITAGLIVHLTGWVYADTIMAAAIGGFILPRAYRLATRAGRILVQAAPEHIDVERLREDLLDIPDVIDVHDLHVWTLTSRMDVASVHLMIPDGVDPHPVLDRARHLLRVDHRLDHATLQVEPSSHTGCHEINW